MPKTKTWSLEWACLRKTSYETREEAAYDTYLNSSRNATKKLSVYQCSFCQGFHITKQLGDEE